MKRFVELYILRNYDAIVITDAIDNVSDISVHTVLFCFGVSLRQNYKKSRSGTRRKNYSGVKMVCFD